MGRTRLSLSCSQPTVLDVPPGVTSALLASAGCSLLAIVPGSFEEASLSRNYVLHLELQAKERDYTH